MQRREYFIGKLVGELIVCAVNGFFGRLRALRLAGRSRSLTILLWRGRVLKADELVALFQIRGGYLVTMMFELVEPTVGDPEMSAPRVLQQSRLHQIGPRPAHAILVGHL